MQNALLKNNDLLSQLKNQLRENTPRVEGRIKGTDKTFGFLEAEDGKSYFIAPPHMKKVLPGDVVKGVVHSETDAKGNEKLSFEPEELLEAGLSTFIGRVHKQGNRLQVLPEMHGFNQPLPTKLAAGLDAANFAEGDWVKAELVQHALQGNKPQFLVSVNQLVAQSADAGAPWKVVLARHDLPAEQPVFAQEWQFTEPEGLVREDLTAENFFTLDSHSTQDMDDALAVTALPNGGWRLQVAIADPAAYIQPQSPADLEAQKRAFTLYLPALTVTMLPKEISDNLCSLVALEKRPAMVVSLELNAEGAVVGQPKFCAAWIESKAKLDYQEVATWLEQEAASAWQPETAELAASLQALAALAQARLAWRKDNAVIGQDFVDYQFILNADREVIDICLEERLVSHKMVEEAMLLANLSAAEFFSQQNLAAVYNHHTGFIAEKTEKLQELINTYLPEVSANLNAVDLNELQAYRQLREALSQQPSGWLDSRIRRLQNYAELGAEPAVHLSLGFPCYATWTSPLRRYGDLINLRILKAVLAQQEPSALEATLIEALAQARKLNRQAEREVKDWLYARFLAPQVGQRFEAEIFNINRGGLRVRLLANGASAFVPASSLHANKDELICDAENGWVLVQDKKVYHLTDKLEVELTEVKVDKASLVARPSA